MSFFFDGTGNNREADAGTDELSNVAKLYAAHKRDEESIGQYRIYIPGIGTYFPEIKDPGGTTQGLGFGALGEARINWAFDQFQEKLAYHEAMAQNPRNKITLIRVAVFGFSRGATQARAFARQFQELCRQDGAEWKLRRGDYPVRFYFMGLWDTVASIGVPMSANNTPVLKSVDLMSTSTTLRGRNLGETGVGTLAFGAPGADPAPGAFNGHMDWAHRLDVVPMVEECVHMVAAHEIRNSFPLDSCRRAGSYPASVEEMVYPGAHSDVGGGYRPGEGARSERPGQMLSVIPLRAMHQRATKAGVPLHLLPALASVDPKLPTYFATGANSQPEFTKLSDLWQHYMHAVGPGARPIGTVMNAHMRLYYAWRFQKIALNRRAREQHVDTADEAALRRLEAGWRKEDEDLERRMEPALKEMMPAQRRAEQARTNLDNARRWERDAGLPVDPKLEAAVQQADAELAEKSDPYLRLKARRDTLPGIKGELARNLRLYDEQLLADAQEIRRLHLAQPRSPLRPHYRNLLDAYEAEFIDDRGLRDDKLIAFFDNYVHDSLANFARDATLPSDPRVVYIGDDKKSLHARNDVMPDDAALIA